MIHTVISSNLEENMYIYSNDKNECIVVDPGDPNIEKLIELIEEKKYDLKAILITHGHFDHIMGINELVKYKNIPVYIGKDDIKFLTDSNYSLSKWVNEEFKISENVNVIALFNGDEIFGFKCLNTKGHTSGSTCYYNEKESIIFTGDTLFKMAYGRTDFPTGDSRSLRDSLNELFKLNENTIVYPGHGSSTTIGEEKSFYYGLYY